MKRFIAIGFLILFCLVFESKSEQLLAGDLARALGIHWCVIQLPDDGKTLKLQFVILHADGERDLSGAMGGFEPGSTVIAYIWPSDDAEWLNVSITSKTGVMRTKMKNPESKILSYPVGPGETTTLGRYIIKGSRGDEVSGKQELQAEEFGLFLDTKP
ncbi:MAG: hypothetical protein P1U58_03820 [Verrucomicrobiales bacterium]|nr:hypothetical protein [Verrucomicrobiales bacterium]